MKNLKKIVVILMLLTLCFSMFSMNVYATEGDSGDESEDESGGTGTTSWQSVTQFDGKGDADLDSKTQSIVGAIISVVRIVAVGVAVIMLAFVAIKYMTSAPGDRATIQKHAVVYVVGALVLFGGSGILTIIQKFAANI